MVKTAARGMITKERLSEQLGEQGLRSGGSIRLPPMWPGFKPSASKPYAG